MRFTIKHEIKGRLRIHLDKKRLSSKEADSFVYYMQQQPGVCSVKVYEQTADAAVCYNGPKEPIIRMIQNYHYEQVAVPEQIYENSSRKLNAKYKERLIMKLFLRAGGKLFIPAPIRNAYILWNSLSYLKAGASCLRKRKIEVPVLDAASIGISLIRRDFATASSIMFLLGIGELLEEWTHKKSVDDLAHSMALNTGKVWLWKDGQEIQVSSNDIQTDDIVVVHLGSVIPFDGVAVNGDAMVNQASLTGESTAVHKQEGSYVYAGTVLEEGELHIQVKEISGETKFEKIVSMIEETEKLKSSLEGRAEHIADRLVPYTLAGTGLVYLLTRNVTRALSILMVDFSCALKLAMPLTVLSAIREAGLYGITVKGGKYLEAVAEASTIVFDKTGTLTEAKPEVVEVYSFCEQNPDEILRLAACLEEHFPHSMAKAVLQAAKEKHLVHEEMHSKVEYIVAHGIASTVHGKKVVIGSYHFVFEDEKCAIRSEYLDKFNVLPEEHSLLYLAIEHELSGVICIADPLRENAPDVVAQLKDEGFQKIVMMTGDSIKTASAIARKVGIDQFFAEVLPEDKAAFIKSEQEAGRKVIMVGDGINDSPALSQADAGIAVSDGAALAREIADIMISSNDLEELVHLKKLSNALMKRITSNYHRIIGVNTSLIGLGAAGILQPAVSALLHNTSTLVISLQSMNRLLDS